MTRPPIHREDTPPPPYEARYHETASPTTSTPPVYAGNDTANSNVTGYAPERNERDALLSVHVNVYQAALDASINKGNDESRSSRRSHLCGRTTALAIGIWAITIIFQLVLTNLAEPQRSEFAQAQPGVCVSRGNQEFYARLEGSGPWTHASTCLEAVYSHGWPLDYKRPIYCKRGWWYQYGYWQLAHLPLCIPHWDTAEPQQCVSYATRRWSAELANVRYDRSRACRETPIKLPGGKRCDTPAACHLSRKGVRGEWLVRDDDDAECIPQWTGIHAGDCKIYGVREYTAHLTHVNYSSWTACRDTPIEIHERRQEKPHECRLNKQGAMEGVWHVADEPYCQPNWGPVKSDGCVRAGHRRYASRLWDIRSGDWTTMCQTTPIVIAGSTLPGAMRCIDKGVLGMWGQWVLPDESCANFVEELDTESES